MVNLDLLEIGEEDNETIRRIAMRAWNLDDSFKVLDYMMNITVVHNTIGLNLEKLLKADDFNFQHDIRGIEFHLNKDTGHLKSYFRPRFSAKPVARI